MNVAKWTISIIAVAALIFGAIQTSSLRLEVTEQKAILTGVQQGQAQLNSTLKDTSDELTKAISESEKALSDILNGGIDINSSTPLVTTSFHQPSGIVWSYGTGLPGRGDGELFTPHMIDDLGDGNLLVPEQMNHDVIIINKQTNKIVWQFGDRFTRGKGTGNLLAEPIAAYQIPSGRYKDDILITERVDFENIYVGRFLIVDRQSREIVWEKKVNCEVLDAIPWDDEHIMASYDDPENRVVKIRLSDKAEVWNFQYTTTQGAMPPFYLQKLSGYVPDYGNSYGGDLLATFPWAWGTVNGKPASHVLEIDTSDSSIKWEYGGLASYNAPMVAGKTRLPVRALRYGVNESLTAGGRGIMTAITIIVEEANARIMAVNNEKETLWEIGGVSREWWRPISWLIEPTYVNISQNGNLLVCDGQANRIYELVYPLLPEVTRLGGMFETRLLEWSTLEAGAATTLEVSNALDLHRTNKLAFTVECTYDASATKGIAVHVYTSHDLNSWDTQELQDSSGKPLFGAMPFAAGKTQRKTQDIPTNARYVKVTVENLDENHAVTNIKVMATLGD